LFARALSFVIPAKDSDNGSERADFLTNLPVTEFPALLLARLVSMRWNHETINNDIKTRLGLSSLSSEHVAGVEREIFAHLSVNNAVRLALHATCPQNASGASFIAAAQALAEANAELRAITLSRKAIWNAFYWSLNQHSLDIRPGRTEPRKRRPYKTAFPIFKEPRAQWRAQRKEV
jgi:hypothetical protein